MTPKASSIAIYDAQQHQIKTGAANVDPSDHKHLTLNLPNLPPGFYTIVWSSLSADDGHADRGGFAFTVQGSAMVQPAVAGALPQNSPADSSTSGALEPPVGFAADSLARVIDLVANWIIYLALIMTAGGALFAHLCLLPLLRRRGEPGLVLSALLNRRFASVALITSILGTLAALAALAARLSIAAGGSVTRDMVAASLNSTSGHLWLGSTAAMVAVAAVSALGLFAPDWSGLSSPTRARAELTVLELASSIGLVLQAFNSHIASGHVARQGSLGPIALSIHLLAVAVWVGGLAYAAVVLLPAWRSTPAELRPAIGARAIARFSSLALVSVVAVVISGGYVAWLAVPSPADLVRSGYGRALLLKSLIVLVLVIIGARNRQTIALLRRHRSEGQPGLLSRILLGRMQGEFVLALIAIVAAMFLLELGPPVRLSADQQVLSASATLPPPAGVPVEEQQVPPYMTVVQANDLQARLTVDPPQAASPVTFKVSVNQDGVPIDGAEVKLRLTAQSLDLGTEVLTAQAAGGGQYSVTSPAFAASGQWQVQLVIRRDNVPDAQADVTVPVQAPASGGPAQVLQARLSFDPTQAHVGVTTTVVTVVDQSGQPVNGARIEGNWVMRQHGHFVRTLLDAVPGQAGTYQSRVALTMPGQWGGDLTIRTADGRSAPLQFSFNVSPAPSAIRGSYAELAAGALILLGALAFAVVTLRRRPAGRPVALVAGALLLAGVALVGDAYLEGRGHVLATGDNPVRPSAQSIDAGKQLYAQNCTSCHGSTGHGDGPLAPTLNPPPVDLTVHVNAHSDADLFNWISNGIPGSAMPAFHSDLSEVDRWNILNYLRSIASTQSAQISSDMQVPGALIWGENNTIVALEPKSGQRSVLASLPAGSRVGRPTLSPDGQWYAFQYLPPQDGGGRAISLYLLPAKGGDGRVLLSADQVGGYIGQPIWSRDSDSIYIDEGPAAGAPDSTIVRVALDGSTQTLLKGGGEPTVSPDGKTLVFVKSDESSGGAALWRANIDGSDQQAIPGATFADIYKPVFAPDGSAVSFAGMGAPQASEPSKGFQALLEPPGASAHGGSYEIWTVALDGSQPKQISHIAENRPDLAWSADSQWIAASGDLGVYLIHVQDQKSYLLPMLTGIGLDWIPGKP